MHKTYMTPTRFARPFPDITWIGPHLTLPFNATQSDVTRHVHATAGPLWPGRLHPKMI